ncbi:uncharacterized protein LOC101238033 isoform X2 [Hydra vulgaris]|uniref:uncharacterized protein LOC101238033 isoform X2 n=1 Tax=Hydra vulgaris TaxID=6087 RepID=UPI0032E9E9C4
MASKESDRFNSRFKKDVSTASSTTRGTSSNSTNVNQKTSAAISPSNHTQNEPTIKDRTGKGLNKNEVLEHVEETSSTSLKNLKKSPASSINRNKRKKIRNPTGAVIMPNQPNEARDDEDTHINNEDNHQH